MIRISSRAVLFSAVVFLLPLGARGAEPAKPADDDAEEELVIKVYRVLDLVSPAPNYPYEGTYLPAMGDARLTRPFGGGGGGASATGGMGQVMMGGMGGGMGGMGGGMGGGMFRVNDNLAEIDNAASGGGKQVPSGAIGTHVGGQTSGMVSQQPFVAASHSPSSLRITMVQLIDTITNTVNPETWDEMGGMGSISPIGGALAIRQTPTVQAKVQAFLQAVQHECGTLRTFSIHAEWLWLNSDQLAQLRGKAKAKPPVAEHALDREALTALPADAHRYSGEITCFNGQTVHIISGELQTFVQGGIPVVGGSEIGYQSVLFRPHLGAFLQITPSILPGEEGVLLDLQSSVTRADKPAAPVILNSKASDPPAVQVDRLQIASQEFATSLRVPLDKPVIVGGMTFPHGESEKQSGQIVLVVEVHSSPGP